MTTPGGVRGQVMWALVRDADGVAPRRVPAPTVGADDDVVVAVRAAGVCRTDLRVADEAGPPVILGHEAAGVVAAAGPAAAVTVGAAVMVVPMGADGWLGVDRDGVFAERVRVRAADVRRLPTGMSFAVGAYVEPVAAAMGALRSVTAGARVRIGGGGRIAELTARVVTAAGARVVADGEVDVAIETDGETGSLMAALRPGGTLVLNGRTGRAAGVDRRGAPSDSPPRAAPTCCSPAPTSTPRCRRRPDGRDSRWTSGSSISTTMRAASAPRTSTTARAARRCATTFTRSGESPTAAGAPAAACASPGARQPARRDGDTLAWPER
jgi:hypothetical protein